MADVKVSALPAATTPLGGAEIVVLNQGGTTKSVSVTNLLNTGLNGVGVYAGTGAPIISAANGSIFLRTDGASNTGVYERVGGAWVPLVATATVGGFGLNNSGVFSAT